jgi:beta-1,2-mannobiose phosphorylase / 1,2-beta-oligomannan phosphorylase
VELGLRSEIACEWTLILMTRREMLMAIAITGLESSILRGLQVADSAAPGDWKKYAGNPVLDGQYGTCFDICVLREQGQYRMWVSWRPKKSVALTESDDGIHWGVPQVVLPPEPKTGWEDDINRPVIVHREDGYHMWYTGQANGRSRIGYAKSTNGRDWLRISSKPVLESTLPWEGVAVMCPHVMWDQGENCWKLWYSGGEQYEPNAIGYATSADGLHWVKYPANPVLVPSAGIPWEKQRVTAAQVILWEGWYYAFYIGFRDVDHAQIGLARSRDGVTSWARNSANPIVRPTPGGWDADACYKPYALLENDRWMLWYNGRSQSLEQIGLVTHVGKGLGF